LKATVQSPSVKTTPPAFCFNIQPAYYKQSAYILLAITQPAVSNQPVPNQLPSSILQAIKNPPFRLLYITIQNLYTKSTCFPQATNQPLQREQPAQATLPPSLVFTTTRFPTSMTFSVEGNNNPWYHEQTDFHSGAGACNCHFL
jgi:hypothetical protein